MWSHFIADRRSLVTSLLPVVALLAGLESLDPVLAASEVQSMSSTSTVVTMTNHDDGREVVVPVGGTVVLRLEAVPGTGYGWQITKDPAPHLAPVGQPFFEPSGKVEAGGPEEEVFHFRAVTPGRARLELEYRRPFEKEALPFKTYRIGVRVE
ncbi:MAG: protease inhibitor I42 family protein [bacterium]